MRLATIYAVLDRDDAIRLCHLEAALEVWRYADESARYVFGDAIGDPKADEALGLLRAATEGLSRDQLNRSLFSKHGGGGLDRVLEQLHAHGLAQPVRIETGGRPAERWVLSTHAGKAAKAGKGPRYPAYPAPQGEPGEEVGDL